MDNSDEEGTSASTSSSSLFLVGGDGGGSVGSDGTVSPTSISPARESRHDYANKQESNGAISSSSDRFRSLSLPPSYEQHGDDRKSGGSRPKESVGSTQQRSSERRESAASAAINLRRGHTAASSTINSCTGVGGLNTLQISVERTEAGSEIRTTDHKQRTSGSAGGRRGPSRNRDSGTGPRNRTGLDRRERPLSAPAKAYPPCHEYLLQRDGAEGVQAVEAGTKTLESPRDCPRRHPKSGERLTSTRAVEKSHREQVQSFRATWDGSHDVQREATSLLSASVGASPHGGIRRSGADLRNCMFTGATVERLCAAGCEEVEEAPVSPHDFGLRRWKEYAVLRHGTNKRFVNSWHGKEILLEIASGIRAQEVEDLQHELQKMRELAEELHAALRAQHAEKAKLQCRLVALEREAEGMDFARRRWLRHGASSRGRGSNLERRLAGNTGNLRTFLFGPGAKPESSNAPAASLEVGSVRSSSATRGSISPNGARGTSRVATGAPPTPSCAGEDDDIDDAADGQREVLLLRRVEEKAELEKSELRRRHEVEMSSKLSRIEKMRLEIKKLEAERDGLRKAAETQAELFSDGYAELRACLDELTNSRTSSSGDAAHNPNLASEPANNAAPSVKIKPAVGDEHWMRATLATEEGLNRQVQTLQALLLEAVSAAVPTVVMPPAVTAAVDSIRVGMGMPPFPWAQPHSHSAQPHSHSAQPLDMGASPRRLAGALPNENNDDYEISRGQLDKRFYYGKTNEASTIQSPSASRLRHHSHVQPPPLTSDAKSRPPLPQASLARATEAHEAELVHSHLEVARAGRDGSAGERIREDEESVGVTTRVGGVGCHGEFKAPKETRAMWSRTGNTGADNIVSYVGSGGSGVLFPPVVPTDDESEEEGEEQGEKEGKHEDVNEDAAVRTNNGKLSVEQQMEQRFAQSVADGEMFSAGTLSCLEKGQCGEGVKRTLLIEDRGLGPTVGSRMDDVVSRP